jgi:hypothetical protein
MGTLFREWLRLVIEAELLKTNPSQEDEEDGVEEMTSCGSIGAMGYQLPLGMDSDSVNVKTPSRKNRKKKNKK